MRNIGPMKKSFSPQNREVFLQSRNLNEVQGCTGNMIIDCFSGSGNGNLCDMAGKNDIEKNSL